MSINRTYRAILVFLFVGLLGGFGPAIDGSACAPMEDAPSIAVGQSFAAQTLTVDACGGVPGGVAAIELTLPTGSMQLPIEFDTSGQAQIVVSFASLNNGIDLLVGLRLIVVAADGTLQTSPMWALQTRNYVVTDPSNSPCERCPVTEGEWTDFIHWPGETGGPTYARTQVAIFTAGERDGSQPMLVLESGPAGSFPIN